MGIFGFKGFGFRGFFVVLVLVILSVNLQAKTVLALVKGGVETFIPGGNDAFFYDPVSRYAGSAPEEVALVHGLDALAVQFAQIADDEFVARVFARDTSLWQMRNWVMAQYQPGDKVYVVGYSAGGGIALRATNLLNGFFLMKSVPVQALVLIDEKSPIDAVVYSNVKNVYIYRQDAQIWNPFPGVLDAVYSIENPEETTVFEYMLPDTNHLSIDNDRCVWKYLPLLWSGQIAQNANTGEEIAQILDEMDLEVESIDGPSDGTPWDDDNDGRVGVSSLKAIPAWKFGWRSFVEAELGKIPSMVLRASFAQIDGAWPDGDLIVEFYLSKNQDYGDGDDIYLGDAGVYFPADYKKKQNVYFYTDLGDYITEVGEYCIFVVAYYGKNDDGGIAHSREGVQGHRIKVTVKEAVKKPSFDWNFWLGNK